MIFDKKSSGLLVRTILRNFFGFPPVECKKNNKDMAHRSTPFAPLMATPLARRVVPSSSANIIAPRFSIRHRKLGIRVNVIIANSSIRFQVSVVIPPKCDYVASPRVPIFRDNISRLPSPRYLICHLTVIDFPFCPYNNNITRARNYRFPMTTAGQRSLIYAWEAEWALVLPVDLTRLGQNFSDCEIIMKQENREEKQKNNNKDHQLLQPRVSGVFQL